MYEQGASLFCERESEYGRQAEAESMFTNQQLTGAERREK